MAKLLTGTRVYGTANVDNVLTVGNVTPVNSTSNTTGSLIVVGGVGITGNTYTGNLVVSGTVGIGTTTPAGKLDVSGDVISQTSLNAAASFYFQAKKSRGTVAVPLTVNNGDTLGGLLGLAYDGTAYRGTGAIEFKVNGTVATNSIPTDIAFFTGVTGVPSGASERMRIDSSGNIGIGTTTMTGKLNVTGAAAGLSAYLTDATNSSLAIRNALGGVILGTDAGGQIHLATNGNTTTERRLSIDANGNVGIGNHNNAINALRYLDIQNTNSGTSAGTILRFVTYNAANNAVTTVDVVKYRTGGFYINNNDTDAANFTAFNVGASERMRIFSSGGVSIGNTTDPGASNLSISGSTISATASAGASVEGLFTNTNAGASASAGVRGVANSTGYFLLRQYGTGVTGTTVFGQALANYSLLLSDGASSNGLMLGSFTADPVIIGTNNAERMRIDSSGNVGIGTTTMHGKFNSIPKSTFNATGTTWAEAALSTQSTYGGGLSMIDGSAGYLLAVQDSGATFVIRQGTVGSAATERMRIDSAGDVGIGTSDPVNKLDVVGDGVRSVARASTTAGEVLIEAQVSNYWSVPNYTGTSLRQSGSTATGTYAGLSNANLGSLIFQNGSAGLIATNGGSPIVIATASVERMRIAANGDLSVGANLSYYNANSTLHVEGSFAIGNTSTSNSATMIYNASLNSIDFYFN